MVDKQDDKYRSMSVEEQSRVMNGAYKVYKRLMQTIGNCIHNDPEIDSHACLQATMFLFGHAICEAKKNKISFEEACNIATTLFSETTKVPAMPCVADRILEN